MTTDRVLDTRLPLAWLITSAFSVVVAIGGFYVKLDTISAGLVKLEAKTDKRDDSIAGVLMNIAEIKGVDVAQTEAINRSKEDIARIAADINEIKNSQRYTPK